MAPQEELGEDSEHEAWLHANPEALKAVQEGLAQARQGLVEADAIDLSQYEPDQPIS